MYKVIVTIVFIGAVFVAGEYIIRGPVHDMGVNATRPQ
jgi:hypothetical protein